MRAIDPRAARWQPASGRQQRDRRGERGLGGRISWICGRLGEKPSLLVTALPLRVEGGAVHSLTETTLTGGLAPTLQESSKHFLPKAACCSRRLCSGILGLLSRFLTSLPPALSSRTTSSSASWILAWPLTFASIISPDLANTLAGSPVLAATLYPQFSDGHRRDEPKEKSSVAVTSPGVEAWGLPLPQRPFSHSFCQEWKLHSCCL